MQKKQWYLTSLVFLAGFIYFYVTFKMHQARIAISALSGTEVEYATYLITTTIYAVVGLLCILLFVICLICGKIEKE